MPPKRGREWSDANTRASARALEDPGNAFLKMANDLVEEKRDLKDQITDLTFEIGGLTKERLALQNQLDSQRLRVAELEKKVSDLEAEKGALAAEMVGKDRTISMHHNATEELRSQIASQKARSEKLANDVLNKDAKIRDLNERQHLSDLNTVAMKAEVTAAKRLMLDARREAMRCEGRNTALSHTSRQLVASGANLLEEMEELLGLMGQDPVTQSVIVNPVAVRLDNGSMRLFEKGSYEELVAKSRPGELRDPMTNVRISLSSDFWPIFPTRDAVALDERVNNLQASVINFAELGESAGADLDVASDIRKAFSSFKTLMGVEASKSVDGVVEAQRQLQEQRKKHDNVLRQQIARDNDLAMHADDDFSFSRYRSLSPEVASRHIDISRD